MTENNQIKWKPTVNGYTASLLDGKYFLEVWQEYGEPGWFASVNAKIIPDEENKSHEERYLSADWAKIGAQEKAIEMMRKDGLIEE